MKLRPVTFRYKNDPAGTLQYGLVAEEVEKLYPELVTHAADGRVQSVRYSMLTGMLLNDLQKQDRETGRLSASAASTDRRIAYLNARHDRRCGRCRPILSSVWRRLSGRWQRRGTMAVT